MIVSFLSIFNDSIIEFLQRNCGSSSSLTFALKIPLNQSLLSDKGIPGEGISAKVSLMFRSNPNDSFRGFAVSCALKSGLDIASKLEERS